MKAMDVARVLCWLAENEASDGEDRLTNMRVQKLLYYCQGWHLAETGSPLFDESIEAWVHGPVVRGVYGQLRPYGANVIDPKDLGGYEADPTDAEERFIVSVWNTYKDYSTTSLRDMTHRETPWRTARRGIADDAPSEAEIGHESMAAYFLPRLTVS